jgi:glycosyltransferase involved in cell wall biosynthesis
MVPEAASEHTPVQVLAVLPSLGAGGAERSTAESIAPLKERGVEISVATMYRALDGVHDETARLHNVHELAGNGHLGRLRSLRQLIKARRPDVVHTAVFQADILGRIASIGMDTAVLSSLVNTQYDPSRRGDPAVARWKLEGARLTEALTGRLLSDRFHAISVAAKEAAVRDLHLPADRIEVVTRGRLTDRLGAFSEARRAQVRLKLGIGPRAPVVLNVGRQEWQKGQVTLLNAAAKLRKSHPGLVILIAGRPGNESDRLRALSDRLDLTGTVRFLGHVEEVGDLLCASDVFAFPSRYEGLGGALLEAMCVGVAIVATDTGAAIETVGDAGLLVPIDDADTLADGLQRLLEDWRLRTHLVEMGQRRFENNFSFETVMDQMAALYRGAAAR